MSDVSNDDKYRDSMEPSTQQTAKQTIGICSWCKDQVAPAKELEHASTCALIPADEKAKIAAAKKGAVETLVVEDLRKS